MRIQHSNFPQKERLCGRCLHPKHAFSMPAFLLRLVSNARVHVRGGHACDHPFHHGHDDGDHGYLHKLIREVR